MAEALAIVSSVSAVVQLLQFSSQCIAKGFELHRSANGIIQENAAIELVTKHLMTLRAKVETEAVSLGDVPLQELCTEVAEASTQLLEALEKVKVKGERTIWKTVREAIRSVWSKNEVLALEQRLSVLRFELNLHITVDIRKQLGSLVGDMESHSNSIAQKHKAIIDAIMHNRNIFEVALQNQNAAFQTSCDDIKAAIHSSREANLVELQSIAADAEATNHAEHEQTRQEIKSEIEEATALYHQYTNAITQQIASVETEVVKVVHIESQINHDGHSETQMQIGELKRSLQELSEQMVQRHRELKEIVQAFQTAKNKKVRTQLSERCRLVTAAIMALETMYRSLKGVLCMLQGHARDVLEILQSSSPQTVRQSTSSLRSSSSGGSSSINLTPNPNPYATHDLYFAYFYEGAYERSELIDATAMEERWKFQHDGRSIPEPTYEGFTVNDSPCNSKCLWLLASLTLALEMHLSPEDATFDVISKILDRRNVNGDHSFAAGSMTGRLKSDIRYWSAFARSRGLQVCMTGEKFEYSSLETGEKEDLDYLLYYLVGMQCKTKIVNEGFGPGLRAKRAGGFIKDITKCLRYMGLSYYDSSGFCVSQAEDGESVQRTSHPFALLPIRLNGDNLVILLDEGIYLSTPLEL